ncbi:MAG: Txe/YoeB family addiction module toxin [Candidatus Kapaibacterium sp.]|nr:MAG: Txe/YoeB family addiction module toxin [Candidatus Kapabacteria bacterium]
MRNIAFTPLSIQHITDWGNFDRKIFNKIMSLLQEAAKTPFEGTGKPEALKHNYQGCWSRRITQEHRLIYRVSDTTITVISCKAHYD